MYSINLPIVARSSTRHYSLVSILMSLDTIYKLYLILHEICFVVFFNTMISFVFFFSSRRRHTRLQGDWSSDVCSSDLARRAGRPWRMIVRQDAGDFIIFPRWVSTMAGRAGAVGAARRARRGTRGSGQIGRGSGRGRGEISGGGGSFKKKKKELRARGWIKKKNTDISDGTGHTHTGLARRRQACRCGTLMSRLF